MAKNLLINGVTYNAVDSLSVPISGGGTAAFPDTSDATADAADIASGETAYVNGVKVTGTATGGGGGGKETGTFTPASFITLRNNRYTINHTLGVVPSYIVVWFNALIGVTDSRIANQCYFSIAYPTRCFCAIHSNSTSYDKTLSMSADRDWTLDPQTTDIRFCIGYVTDTSFTLGSDSLGVGLGASLYRWMVVA